MRIKKDSDQKITKMTSPMWRFALSLFYTLLLYTVFGIMVFMIVLNYFPENGPLLWFTFALIAFITLCGLYSASWRFGERDRNLVKFGHILYSRWRGTFAGLYACAPFLIGVAALFAAIGPRVWLYAFTALLLVPAACGIGYIMGHRLYSIRQKLIYTDSKKKNDKRMR